MSKNVIYYYYLFNLKIFKNEREFDGVIFSK